MMYYFARTVLRACLLCALGTLGLFGQHQEVLMPPHYGPKTQDNTPDEVTLYDVAQLKPDTMIVNRAHWTHGAAGAIYTQKGQLSVSDSMQLLTEDPAETYPLPVGKVQVALDLGDYFDVSELIFYSVNAKGLMSVEYTNRLNGSKATIWKPLADKVPYDKNGVVEVPIQGISARYIRIIFNTTEAGEIANLSMLGTRPINVNGVKVPGALENFAANEDEVYARNLAGLHRGTSVSYVSSGNLEDVDSMLDNDFRSGYTFDEEDKAPVWVVKLPGDNPVNKVSLLAHSSHPGTIEFYVIDTIPTTNSSSKSTPGEAMNDAKKINLPPDFFTTHEPFYTKEVHPHSDWRVSSDPMNMDKKTEGQYIVMRWIPADGASTEGDPLIVKQVYATKVSDNRIFSPQVSALQNPEIATYSLEVQSLNTQMIEGGITGYSAGGSINTVDRVRVIPSAEKKKLPPVSR